MEYRHLAIIGAIGALGLAACGSDDNSTSSSGPHTSMMASMPATADFNTTDVEFAQQMIPHHQQAVEMADIALDPSVAAGAQVQDLATRIKAAQDPEVQMMSGWLTEWGQPMQMETTDQMSTMDGMMSAEEMDSLRTMNGVDFDTMWLQMMIRHHEGAIATAQTAKASGANADSLALADQIIAAQQAEIAEMQTLLGS